MGGVGRKQRRPDLALTPPESLLGSVFGNHGLKLEKVEQNQRPVAERVGIRTPIIPQRYKRLGEFLRVSIPQIDPQTSQI